jgi:hypothetical protein
MWQPVFSNSAHHSIIRGINDPVSYRPAQGLELESGVTPVTNEINGLGARFDICEMV